MEEVLISESLSSVSTVRETNLRSVICVSGMSKERANERQAELESQGYAVELIEEKSFSLRAEKIK